MFTSLVVGGGELKGIISIGALHYIYENVKTDFRTFSGTSIGSIICTLLICGYTPMEMFSHFYNDENFFNMTSLKMEISLGGMFDIKDVTQSAKNLIIKKVGFLPTFKQLYDLSNNKKLYICSVNISKSETVHFSVDTHPDLLVSDAIDMSCNIPFVFKKILYKGDYYIDGGLVDNVPYSVLPKEEKSLAIMTNGRKDVWNLPDVSLPNYFYNELLYLTAILHMPMQKLRDESTNDIKKNYKNMEYLDIPYYNPGFALSIKRENKMKMFKNGFSFAKTEMEKIYL